MLELSRTKSLELLANRRAAKYSLLPAAIVVVNIRPKFSVLVNGRGKATPLKAWIGPEGSRRLWLPDFKALGT